MHRVEDLKGFFFRAPAAATVAAPSTVDTPADDAPTDDPTPDEETPS